MYGDDRISADNYFSFCVYLRLCVDKKVPTLPDGVTLRDDPMAKTIAFLNFMPKLT